MCLDYICSCVVSGVVRAASSPLLTRNPGGFLFVQHEGCERRWFQWWTSFVYLEFAVCHELTWWCHGCAAGWILDGGDALRGLSSRNAGGWNELV